MHLNSHTIGSAQRANPCTTAAYTELPSPLHTMTAVDWHVCSQTIQAVTRCQTTSSSRWCVCSRRELCAQAHSLTSKLTFGWLCARTSPRAWRTLPSPSRVSDTRLTFTLAFSWTDMAVHAAAPGPPTFPRLGRTWIKQRFLTSCDHFYLTSPLQTHRRLWPTA